MMVQHTSKIYCSGQPYIHIDHDTKYKWPERKKEIKEAIIFQLFPNHHISHHIILHYITISHHHITSPAEWVALLSQTLWRIFHSVTNNIKTYIVLDVSKMTHTKRYDTRLCGVCITAVYLHTYLLSQ